MNGVTYFVTDIEADGPDPELNSMLSFACVRCDVEHGIIDAFEANLAPLPDRIQNMQTMDWWLDHPDAYKASTANPQPAAQVMRDFADWVTKQDGLRVFAASPFGLDGKWINTYLLRFLDTRIYNGPFKGLRVFDSFGLDMPSFMAGLFGWPVAKASELIHQAGADWRGETKHTHRAIDDAMGYANILIKALRLSAQRSKHPADFASYSS